MHEGNLVICDQEQQYARNLLQMFSRNREAGIQMYLFHTVEEVERFAEQKPVHTLLIDKEYPPELREQIPAAERYVLITSRQDPLAENEEGVYRYQSAEAIWLQMRHEPAEAQDGRTSESEKPGTGERRKKQQNSGTDERGNSLTKANTDERRQARHDPKTDPDPDELPEPKPDGRKQKASAGFSTGTKGELIGVYSPVHRIGKTRFALELGREMAKKEPVLYLNLEEYAGGSYYFPDQTGQTLADLLYYSRQEKGNLGLRISTMAGQDGALDYILPMPYVQDMQGISGEEWLGLFGQILENCIYQKVILDLGDSVDGLFQILEACHTVYTPYIEDGAARAKLNQYAENLRKTGREQVLERTIQKKLKQR